MKEYEELTFADDFMFCKILQGIPQTVILPCVSIRRSGKQSSRNSGGKNI